MKPTWRLLAAASILTALGLRAEAQTNIGIVVETLGNPYFACVKEAAEEEASKHSDLDLTVIGAATGTDLAGMTRMIEDLTQAQVDVLAFNAVDPNAMISTAKKVQTAGINVLIHSDDLAEQVADHFVGPDQYAGQAAVAEMVASELDGSGTVAILEGVPGNMSSLLRKKGAEETLAKYPDIEIVGVWAANWDRAQGLQKAEDILTAHPDISAIIAVNDEAGDHTRKAVRQERSRHRHALCPQPLAGSLSAERRASMDTEHHEAGPRSSKPWNKGRLAGAKPPLQPKHVWAIRTRLQIANRMRDQALFNLAIDRKLRGCDVVGLKVEDVAPHGYAVDRATIRQRKTGRPVKFELTEQTRQAVDNLVAASRSPPRQPSHYSPICKIAWRMAVADRS